MFRVQGRAPIHQQKYVLSLLLVSGCATSTRAPSPQAYIHVATHGDDAHNGSKEAPLRTLARALQDRRAKTVFLAAGNYQAPKQSVTTTLHLRGPKAGGAKVTGLLKVAGPRITLEHVHLVGSIEATQVHRLMVQNATISAGGHNHGIRARQSRITLKELKVKCGALTCIDAQSSTVAAERTTLTATPEGRRGLFAKRSRVRLHHFEVTGTKVSQIQGKNSRFEVHDTTLFGALGSALVLLKNTRLDSDNLSVQAAAKIGILIQASRATLRGTRVDAGHGMSMGIAGSSVSLSDAHIQASRDGGLTTSGYRGMSSGVTITGGVFFHERRSAILHANGTLKIKNTRFEGSLAGDDDGGEALIASGPHAKLIVHGAVFDKPSSYGLLVANDASAHIRAAIRQPRVGGILVEDIAGGAVTIENTTIEGCITGPGITALGVSKLTIKRSRVESCHEAGILAGQKSHVTVEDTKLKKNGRYGLAAFGGASIHAQRSVISGSQWAVFAACGDNARIEDAGSNRWKGKVAPCP